MPSLSKPNFKFLPIVFGALFLLLAPILALSSEGSVVGKLMEFEGEVEIVRAADGQVHPASKGMSLLNGDIARVKLGTAEIEFSGGDFMMVYPNSEVNILEEKGENVSVNRKIGVTFGKIWVDKKSHKDVGTEFVTRAAVAGVRGCQIMVTVDKVTGMADFFVRKGILRVTPIVTNAIAIPVPVYSGSDGARVGGVFTTTGSTVTVPAGKHSTVIPGQSPSKPTAFEPGTVPSSKTEAQKGAKEALKEAIKAGEKQGLKKESKKEESKKEEKKSESKESETGASGDESIGETIGDAISQSISEEISEQIGEEISEQIGEEISEKIIEEIIKKEIEAATVNIEIVLK